MANIGTKLLSQAVPTSSLYWGRNGQSLKIPPFMVRKGEDKLNDQELFEYSISEYNKPFSGWDFSHIHSRMKEDKLTWNYEETVLNETRNVNYLLDMGTGGGEFLSTLAPLPPITYATEAYQPNVPIAQSRLGPLGVKVIGIDDDEKLPLSSNMFELVINRHEAYSDSEVYRIMQSGGTFITQQVGGENERELNRILGDESQGQFAHWNLKFAVERLRQQGFIILDQKEEFPVIEFKDVGAIIYYLKAIPWQVEDFTVERYFGGLKRIYKRIVKEGSFKVNAHRFMIKAEKR